MISACNRICSVEIEADEEDDDAEDESREDEEEEEAEDEEVAAGTSLKFRLITIPCQSCTSVGADILCFLTIEA